MKLCQINAISMPDFCGLSVSYSTQHHLGEFLRQYFDIYGNLLL